MTDMGSFLFSAKLALISREADLEAMHWFIGDDADEGLSYCRNCISKLHPDAKIGEDYTYDGTYNMEEDSPETCEECGKLLAYTLTGYGVDSELEHFSNPDVVFNWRSPTQCYEIARVANGIVDDDEKRNKAMLAIYLRSSNMPQELRDLLPISE